MTEFVLDYVRYSVNTSSPSDGAFIVGSSSPPTNWDLVIPATVTYNSVTYNVKKINDSAFGSVANLKNLTIPNSVTEIGGSAFGGAGLTSIASFGGVTRFGYQAFMGSALKSITLPNDRDFTYGGGYDGAGSTFRNCTSLTSVTYGSMMTEIPAYMFQACSSINSFTNYGAITSVGNFAFYNANLPPEFIIPDTVTLLGQASFDAYGLSKVTIGAGVTTIQNYAFGKGPSIAIFRGTNIPTLGGGYGFGTIYYKPGATNVSRLTGFSSVIIEGFPGTFSAPQNVSRVAGLSSATISWSAVTDSAPDAITKYRIRYFNNASSTTISNVDVSGNVTQAVITGLTNNQTYSFSVRAYVNDYVSPASSSVTATPQIIIDYLIYDIMSASDVMITSTSGSPANWDLVIPATVTVSGVTYNVKKINGAFYDNRNIRSVTIPNSVTEIGYSSFAASSLSNIVSWGGVTRLGALAFSNVQNLKSITFPNDRDIIFDDSQTFRYCSWLTSVTYGSMMTKIMDYMFLQCPSLTRFTNGIAVTSIGPEAFGQTSLKEFVISDVMTSLNTNGLAGNPMTLLTIGSALTSISNNVLNQNTISNVIFRGNDIPTIGSGNFASSVDTAYYKTGATNVSRLTPFFQTTVSGLPVTPTTPTGVSATPTVGVANSATINWNAVSGSTKYQISYYAVDTPSSITTVDVSGNLTQRIFTGLANGKTFTFSVKAINEPVSSDNSSPATVTPYVVVDYLMYSVNYSSPSDGAFIVGTSGSPANWDLVIPATVTVSGVTYNVKKINDSTFASLANIKNVTIPNSVTEIGAYAFQSSGLTNVVSWGGVTKIDFQAFRYSAMKSVTFPDDRDILVIKIINSGANTFMDCTSLTSVRFGAMMTEITANMFQNCTALTSFTNSVGATYLDGGAFWGCSSLKEFVITDSLTNITNGLGNSGLTKVTIGTGLTSIGADGFYNCNSLVNVIFNAINIPTISATGNFTSSIDTAYYRPGATNVSRLTPFFDTRVVEGFPSSYQAPINVTATGGISSATISWQDPNAANTITKFRVRYFNNASPATISNVDVSSNVTQTVITGLTNGQTYSFSVRAYVNDSVSEASSSVTATPQIIIDYVIYQITSASDIMITGTSGSPANWDLVIPATVIVSGVTYNVKKINNGAFYDNRNVKNVTIPNSVTEIGYDVFAACLGLTNVVSLGGVTKIGNLAFANTPLNSITFPNDRNIILDGQIFRYCSWLTSVTYGSMMTTIGDYMFLDCPSLTRFTNGIAVTSIGPEAFRQTSLKEFVISDVMTSLNTDGLAGNPMTLLTIGSALTSISNNVLNQNTISNVIFRGNDIPTIGSGNFAVTVDTAYYKPGATNVSRLTPFFQTTVSGLPVTPFAPNYIGVAATGVLNSVLVDWVSDTDPDKTIITKYQVSYYPIDTPSSITTVDVNRATIRYQSTTISGLANAKTFIFSVKAFSGPLSSPSSYTVRGTPDFILGNFRYSVNVSSPSDVAVIIGNDSPPANWDLVLPGTVTVSGLALPIIAISGGVFENVASLRNITIPDSVKQIGGGAFRGSGLTNIVSFGGVTYIGQAAFYSCGLKSVTFPDNVIINLEFNSTGNGLFKNCASLTSVRYGNLMTEIPNFSFQNCTSLTSFTNYGPLTQIADAAFQNTNLNQEFIIPETIGYLGPDAFNQSGITKVTIPSVITSINGGAFQSRSNELATVIFKGTNMPTIGSSAFNSPVDTAYYTPGATNISRLTPFFQTIVEGFPSNFQAPINVTATGGISSATISWQDPNAANTITKFRVRYFNNASPATISNVDVSGNVTQAVITGLTNGQTYSFSVRAYVNDSVSEASASVTATPNIIIDYLIYQITSASDIMIIGTSGSPANWDLVIPATVTVSGVTYNVKKINHGAFGSLANLKNLTIPNNVTEIGNDAFSGSGLTSIASFGGVTRFGYQAFMGSALKSIILPNDRDFTYGGGYNGAGSTFRNCTSLTSVTYGSMMTEIPPYMFQGCGSINSFTNYGAIIAVGEFAFYQASLPSEFIIPDTVVYIGRAALAGNGLSKVTIGSGVTSIQPYGFATNSITITIFRGTNIPDIGGSNFGSGTAYYRPGATNVSRLTGIFPTIIEGLLGNFSAPQNVTVGAVNSSATVNWSAVTDSAPDAITKYRISYFNTLTPATIINVDVSGNITQTVITGLTNGQTYRFSVRAYANDYVSPASSSVTETPFSLPAPTVFYGFQELNAANINWQAVIVSAPYTITKYQISYYDIDTSSNITTVDVSANITQKTITGLTNAKTFEFSLKAFVNSISSPASYTIRIIPYFIIDSIIYRIIDGEAHIIGNSSPPANWDLVTPATIICSGITYNVKKISGQAFQSVSSLRNLTIPNSVTEIGAYAFQSSGLTNVISWGGVTRLGYQSFMGSALKSVTLPNDRDFTYSGGYDGPGNVFRNCLSLTSVTYGSMMTEIPYGMFQGSSLRTLTNYGAVTAIKYYSFEGTRLTPPEFIISDAVTELGPGVFANSGLTKITIGSGITDIPIYAFLTNSIISTIFRGTNIPNLGVGNFGSGTAYYRPGATNVSRLTGYFPTIIEGLLGNFSSPQNVTGSAGIAAATITWSAVTDSAPDAITKYRISYFNTLTPATITTLDVSGNITQRTITGLTNNQTYSFSLRAYANDYVSPVSASVTATPFAIVKPANISSEARVNAVNVTWSAVSVLAPNTVTKYQISYYDIDTPSNFYTVDVSGNILQKEISGLTPFKTYAFTVNAWVNSLSGEVSNATQATPYLLLDYVVYQVTSPTDVIVRTNQSPPLNWDLVIPATVTSSGVTYNVKMLLWDSFIYCANIRNVTIPNSVTEVQGQSFRYSGLTNIVSWGGVTTLGIHAFATCGLKSVTFPNDRDFTFSLAYGPYFGETFKDCTSLTSVTYGSMITTIPRYMFQGCGSLTSFTNYGGITSIGSDVFNGCSLNQEFVIPDSVSVLNGAALSNSGINKVTIGGLITNIGDYTFSTQQGRLLIAVFKGNDIPIITGTNNFNSTGDTAYYRPGATNVSRLTPFFTNIIPGLPGDFTAPQNVTATSGINEAIINWSAVSSSTTITNYIISYYNTLTPSSITTVDVSGNLTQKTITGLTNFQTYGFSIKAYSGDYMSVVSSTVTATPYSINAPQNVTGSAGINAATINWSAVTVQSPYNITKYQISYYNTVTPSSIITVDVSSNLTQKEITGLTNFQTYGFSVKAFVNTFSSVASSTVTITPFFIDAPVNVTGSAGISAATINWSAVSVLAPNTVTKYQISYYDVVTPSSITTVDVASNLTQKVITGLTIRNSYGFSVKAFVNSLTSASSSTVIVELSVENVLSDGLDNPSAEPPTPTFFYELVTTGFTTDELLGAGVNTIPVTSGEAIANLLENFDFPTINITSDITIPTGTLQSNSATISISNLTGDSITITNNN